VLMVFAGGVVGSASRVGIAEVTSTATMLLIVNLTGSLLLGLLVGWRMRSAHPAHGAIEFLGIGLLGAFTTFSAFAVAIADGPASGGAVLAAVSVVLGVVLARLGILAGAR
jgi:fluoride exporter